MTFAQWFASLPFGAKAGVCFIATLAAIALVTAFAQAGKYWYHRFIDRKVKAAAELIKERGLDVSCGEEVRLYDLIFAYNKPGHTELIEPAKCPRRPLIELLDLHKTQPLVSLTMAMYDNGRGYTWFNLFLFAPDARKPWKLHVWPKNDSGVYPVTLYGHSGRAFTTLSFSGEFKDLRALAGEILWLTNVWTCDEHYEKYKLAAACRKFAASTRDDRPDKRIADLLTLANEVATQTSYYDYALERTEKLLQTAA